MSNSTKMRWLLILSSILYCNAQFDPHFWKDRNVIVHLFEWKYKDIADECERFLAPKGFAGVQISVPSENAKAPNREWWERYQPVSYKLVTRSGDENDFKDMTKRCNDVGIRIYADVVFNHMAGMKGEGTGGSMSIPGSKPSYPGVPYGPEHFTDDCPLNDYSNKNEVRNCRLQGMPDLNQAHDGVRKAIVDYLNKMIDLGVAGFRVDAAKHMWPGDLKAIYDSLKPLNDAYGFPKGARPFIAQEVIDLGDEPISINDYAEMGTVTEFKYSSQIGKAFKGWTDIAYLEHFGQMWGFLPSEKALSFVENHDNQRNGAGGPNILKYKDGRPYKMAVAFHLAWPYGVKRVMSSFAFSYDDQGPPADEKGNIISPVFGTDGACVNGWVCEHRWRQIYNMVGFSNAVNGTSVEYWTKIDSSQIAYGRGNKGFIVFNNSNRRLSAQLQTGLEPGIYCDVISGSKVENRCTGASIAINLNRKGYFEIEPFAEDGVVAIHVNSKLNCE